MDLIHICSGRDTVYIEYDACVNTTDSFVKR